MRWFSRGVRSDSDLVYDRRGNAMTSAPGMYAGRIVIARLACAVMLLMFALGGGGSAAAQEMQVIELHHRVADEVIPNLRPLLDPGGVLTGMDSTLFVRTSPENFEQLRQAV